ncbi:fimbrial protein [Scandinavium sp. NPDC088450]|uniref:fimbrial protein n=1 Tax=Scandinavium sp. NPDC088450 TaxID=3364514 RepID=UPI00384B253F
MNRNTLSAVIAATAVLSMSNVFAAAGTVNFTGKILDSACAVDVASQNQTVDLGEYYKTEFTGVGSKTAAKGFNVVLKNCPPSVGSAKVVFDGTPEASNSALLAIDSTLPGAATGVAINLMSADKTDLPLNGSNGYNYVLSSTQDNTLNFYAQYQSTLSTVGAGPANSVANFSVVYN